MPRKTHEEIQGWFDFPTLYFEQVRSYASAHFVEVGAWLGKSACYMGEQIRELGRDIKFDVVDTWKGSPPSPCNRTCTHEAAGEDLYERFQENVRDCELENIIHPIRMASTEAAQMYPDKSLDFVFIDGDHNPSAVAADMIAWWPKLRPGGTMAGHDYEETGVKDAVNDIVYRFKLPAWQDGRCWAVRKPAHTSARIFLGVPHCGSLNAATAEAAYDVASCRHSVTVRQRASSLLASNFNHLWVDALQGEYDFFVMLHADQQPQRWWVDLLVEEMMSTGVDMLGAVAPIKDVRGLTSLGIADPNPVKCWSPLRRLTIRECCKLPSTFTSADCGYPGYPLLLNTGCWIANLSNQKWKAKNDAGELAIYFTIRDRVWEHEGALVAGVQSEDWFFSRQAVDAGMSLAATRKVNLKHKGSFDYPNHLPWGEWEDDQDTRPLWAEPQEAITH